MLAAQSATAAITNEAAEEVRLGADGSTLLVQGLDGVDGTPLLDLKPDRCAYTPPAPPTAEDRP
jgi:tRNA (Thr-GGU) A37 N-methylase